MFKKGQLLATGPVGSIINSDITVELASNDMPMLKSFLAGIPMVKSLHMLDKFIEITVDQNEDFAVLNKLAFDNGIILTHFVGRKKRLETEFLEITSKSN